MPLNVLYLTINPNRVSTTVATEGWFRNLRSVGLRPVLVSDVVGDFHQWSLDEGIPAYHVPLPFPNKRAPWSFLRSLWRLRRIVARHNIQLIHCNEQDVYPIGGYLARVCKLPVVVTCHFAMERGFCAWAFGRRVPASIFFVSRRSQELCRASLEGIIPADRWRVLHNGLDMAHYLPDGDAARSFRQEHGLQDKILIGTASAFRPRKQLEHFIELGARVADARVAMVLAGFAVAGDETYAEDLLNTARRRLGPRFCFVGRLHDMRPLCNALDLFINTSQEESFGISVLEAMACGCPVIGYDSKAVDEVVLPDGGIIVAQDDVEELVRAVDHAISNPAQLTNARQRARVQAERFDLGRLSLDLWDEYKQVLSTFGAARRPVRAQ